VRELRAAAADLEGPRRSLALAERRSGFLADKWDVYAQLALADVFIENRRRYCRELTARFSGIDGIRVPDTDFDDVASFIYFIRLADAETRSRLIEHMRLRGVATGIHFQGAHEFSFYRNARRSDLSVTDRAASQQLTLPLYSYMDDETFERVVESVTSFFA